MHTCDKKNQKWYEALRAQMGQFRARSPLPFFPPATTTYGALKTDTARRWERTCARTLSKTCFRAIILSNRTKNFCEQIGHGARTLINQALAIAVVGHTSCWVVAEPSQGAGGPMQQQVRWRAHPPRHWWFRRWCGHHGARELLLTDSPVLVYTGPPNSHLVGCGKCLCDQ